ncbi:MAG: NAD(P)-dependent oxidoreductase [Bacteroidota bacterium]
MKKIFITGGSGFIGTNLIQSFRRRGYEILNYDWNPPLNPDHRAYWEEGNIMDYLKMRDCMKSFKPDLLLHLAARTDTDIYDLDADMNEYIVNTQGTKHVLKAIQECTFIEKVIITSTQFVCEAGYTPKDQFDYQPFTLYGKSKILTEKYTHEIDPNCSWTIIRPSTIWGPWALRYRDTLFKVMESGLYFHPAKEDVVRSYGYVKNVVFQIRRILEEPKDKVHKKTLYVGDAPIKLIDWVNCVSSHLTGKKVRTLPTNMVKAIALGGDTLKSLGIGFPITSTRFNSMTQDYISPIEDTIELLGEAPYSMEMGIKEMVAWYRKESAEIIKPEKKQMYYVYG